MDNGFFSSAYPFVNRLISGLALLFMLFLAFSCRKESIQPGPAPRDMQVWLHRVNWIGKAQEYQYAYSGFELDVRFDTLVNTFIVKHDEADTTTLTLSTWLSAITDPSRLGYWLDFKNLDSLNRDQALTELLRIRRNFGLTKEVIVVESSNPVNLINFNTLNFRPSYYIPTFNPDTLTSQQETELRDYTQSYITKSGIGTISGYSMQHSFMQKWFPDMNKLLWYLDSFDPAVKDSVIAATQKDPTVEILLVADYY